MAKLIFRYGAMGSSKTANALMVRYNYLEKGKKVVMLKPSTENRDGEKVIPFEESLSEAQLTTFHKLLDCVSDTAAAEMRAAYKVGFKDGATMMQEIQD